MNILSSCPPIPDQSEIIIFGRDCILHSVALSSSLACENLNDQITFINTHKQSAPLSSYFLDFNLEYLSLISRQASGTQTGPNTPSLGKEQANSYQDAATNTSISISGPAEASPFLEIEENPWKRAWIAWRAGRSANTILTSLANELKDSNIKSERFAGSISGALAVFLHTFSNLLRYISPQLGMGLSVARQLETLSSIPLHPAGNLSALRAIDWHPFLAAVAFGLSNHSVIIQDLRHVESSLGTLKHRYQHNITCLQFSHFSCNNLAVGCQHGVLLWSLEATSLFKSGTTTTYPTKWFQNSPAVPVVSLAWAPNQTLLVSASSAARHMLVIDTATGQSQPVSRLSTRGVSILKWSPDGSKLLAASCTSSFKVWDTETWTCERWDTAGQRIQTAAWSPDSSMLVFAVKSDSALYALSFSNANSNNTSCKCADFSPIQLMTTAGIDVDIGGPIQQITWDNKGQRMAILFSHEAIGNTPSLVLLLRTKISSVLSINPIGFITDLPGAVPLTLAFKPNCDIGATLLIVWSNGHVSVLPIEFNDQITNETSNDNRKSSYGSTIKGQISDSSNILSLTSKYFN